MHRVSSSLMFGLALTLVAMTTLSFAQPARAESAFWQQDAAGGFVNAGTHLANLWGTES